jgi:hypothetical protein
MKNHVFSNHRQGFECCILSFGWFPGVWILYADVSEHTLFHLHRPYAPQRMEQTVCSEIWRYESQTVCSETWRYESQTVYSETWRYESQTVCSETWRYESTSYLLTRSILTSVCRDRCNHSGRQETIESLVWYRGFHPTKCDRFKNFVNCTIYQILG